MHREDVGMIERGRDLDLAQEALGAERYAEIGSQHLHGDLAVVFQVFGEMDGGHPPLAQRALQAVAVGQRLGEARVREHRLNMPPGEGACHPERRRREGSASIGNRRMRFPVPAKMALHTAGAMGGSPASPTPPGGASLGTRWTSISGLAASSSIR